MSYEVIPTRLFKKQAKRLLKKYPSLKEELQELTSSLAEIPEQGTAIGCNTYKIRLAVKSKGRGKSGGMRIITYLVSKEGVIFLLTIYDKSDIDTIDDKTLRVLVRDYMML